MATPEPQPWAPRSAASERNWKQRRKKLDVYLRSESEDYRRGYLDALATTGDERVEVLTEVIKDLDYQMNRLMVWERRLPNVLRNAFLSAGLRLPDRLPAPSKRHADGAERAKKPGRQKRKRLSDYT